MNYNKQTQEYKICTRCVMDTSVPDITFSADGICNYCTEYLARAAHILFRQPDMRARDRETLVTQVRATGHGKAYDCIVGLSGGVDSSWALYQVVQLGLRPLAVHMDNGWDSELAQENIENLVKKLNVDLYTHVIDWDEYRALQQAFFDADVIDIEMLYDNAMSGVNFQQAAKYNLKFILAGTNQTTEGMRIPLAWNWFKLDKKNIYALWKRFGDGRRISTFPAIGTLDYLYYRWLRGIRWISFLDYVNYNKAAALETLQKEFGYRPYPYKHYESIFTRFYQGYLLPRKFGVDKRRLHLSSLIISDQISRKAALDLLQASPYPDEQDLTQDIEYFLKKIGWMPAQLEMYLSRPEKPHALYGSERKVWDLLMKLYSSLAKRA